jgi:flagellar hook-associated protein 2
MPNINFNGLASGLDTGSIIEKLVSLERLPIVRLQQQQSNISNKISLVGSFISKLQDLQAKADTLNQSNAVASFSATSSDEGRLKVTASAGATPGSYSLKVNKLARAETTRSAGFASNVAGVAGNGTLSIQIGSTTTAVAYTSADSLTDIAARINSNVTGSSASVLFDGTNHRLMITSKDTGLVNSMSFSDTGSTLGLTDPGAEIISAQDAEIVLNSTTITRASNTMSDVLTGISFQLRSETPVGGAETTVTVSRDDEGIKTKVQGLLDAYNNVATAISAQLSFTGQRKGEETLFGDSSLQNLQRQLGGVLSSPYSNGSTTSTLGQLGIKINSNGTATLDDTKFKAALAQNPDIVNNLITGDRATGFAAVISAVSKTFSQASTGILAAKQAALRSRSTDLGKRIDRLDSNSQSLETRLRQQFSAMEQAISGLQSQSSFLSNFLNSGR